MDEARLLRRRRRVNQLKKIILTTVLLAIVIPMTGCTIFMIQVFSLKKQIKTLSEAKEELLKTIEDLKAKLDNDEIPVVEIGGNDEVGGLRKVYLTFDDGPSELTDEILTILDQYNVKATFFVTGESAEKHPERYKQIVEKGHAIGIHSYSHDYEEIYLSMNNFQRDIMKMQRFITDTTGVTPTIYRFPGGSSNTVSHIPVSKFCEYLDEQGIVYYDWNISSKDAEQPPKTKEEIVLNCTKNLDEYQNAMILLHDSADKITTVEALPEIIETIQNMEDTLILPITEDSVVIHHK